MATHSSSKSNEQGERQKAPATLKKKINNDPTILKELQTSIIVCCTHPSCKKDIVGATNRDAPLMWNRLQERTSMVCRNQHAQNGFHSCQCTLENCNVCLSVEDNDADDIAHFISHHPEKVNELLDRNMTMKLRLALEIKNKSARVEEQRYRTWSARDTKSTGVSKRSLGDGVIVAV